MKKYNLLGILTAALLLLLAGGCSSVFNAYLEGGVYDAGEYTSSGDGALEGVKVYLYSSEEARDADYSTWYASGAENGNLPEERSVPNYFMMETTDANGIYSFSGFTWHEFQPEFGKTADRQEVYFLFYHEDYGLQKNTTPEKILILSDISNTIPDIRLARKRNSTHVEGVVEDQHGDPLNNVTVEAYVAETWTYTGTVIDQNSIVWPDTPTDQTVTNAEGAYSFSLAYAQLPSSSNNEGTGAVRFVYIRDGYVAEHSTDADIVDAGWDPDADGTDEPYMEERLADRVPKVLPDITLARDVNEADFELQVVSPGTGNGVEGIAVRIYVAEEWEYSAPGVIDTASIVWPSTASISGITDLNGDFATAIEYPRLPDAVDNEGTTRIRVVIEDSDYVWIDSADTAADDFSADAEWDPQGYQDDNLQFNEQELSHGVTLELTYTIKQVVFSNQTLRGYVFEDSIVVNNQLDRNAVDGTDEGVNNIKLALFLDAADTSPYRTAITRTAQNGSETYKGSFQCNQISWTEDPSYTETIAEKTFTVKFDTDRDGVWGGAGDAANQTVILYADVDGGNYAEFEIDL